MSEPVRGLVRLGHPERSPDPTDGRARLVRLTAPGRACRGAALAEIVQIEAAWPPRLGWTGTGLRGALARAIGAPTG